MQIQGLKPGPSIEQGALEALQAAQQVVGIGHRQAVDIGDAAVEQQGCGLRGQLQGHDQPCLRPQSPQSGLTGQAGPDQLS